MPPNAHDHTHTYPSFQHTKLTHHPAASPLLGHLDAYHIPHHAARGHARAGGNLRYVHEEYAGKSLSLDNSVRTHSHLAPTGRALVGLQQPHQGRRHTRTGQGLPRIPGSDRCLAGRHHCPTRATISHDNIPSAREPRDPVRLGGLVGEVKRGHDTEPVQVSLPGHGGGVISVETSGNVLIRLITYHTTYP
jgi:hypothetical protein